MMYQLKRMETKIIQEKVIEKHKRGKYGHRKFYTRISNQRKTQGHIKISKENCELGFKRSEIPR